MTNLPRVLLTGFEPFGGESINPSWEAVRRLHGEVIDDHELVARCLPVVFGAALDALDAAIGESSPALVIALGQAGGRAAIALERVALNLEDARIPDNAGVQPLDRPVRVGGPAAHFATLPLKAIRAELLAAGLPAELSLSAGSFVCNHVFYGLMDRLTARPGVRGGFIHIPYLPQQVATRTESAPSLALDDAVRALRIAVATALRGREDIRAVSGTIC